MGEGNEMGRMEVRRCEEWIREVRLTRVDSRSASVILWNGHILECR